MDNANIGQITFNVVTGVPSADDDAMIEMPKLPGGQGFQLRSGAFAHLRAHGVGFA